MRAQAMICVLLATGCAKKEEKVVTGAAVPVDVTGDALPPGHPAVDVAGQPAGSITALPPNGAGHQPVRVSVDQLRAALLRATGQSWVGRLSVADPSSPSGTTLVDDADLLEAFASSLGRPDYRTSVNEGREPGVTFSKLASDAARFTCRAGVAADVLEADASKRFILHSAAPNDTVATAETAIRANVTDLALTFWGRTLSPQSAEVDQLVSLFQRVSTALASRDDAGTTRLAGTPLDGWRAVCIAMATDTRFLTY